MTGTPSTLTVSLVPDTDDFDDLDDRRYSEVAELDQEMRREVPDAIVDPDGLPGAKGVELLDVVVTLASAGVFTAALDAVKTWLQRDPAGRRSVTAHWSTVDEGGVRRSGSAVITGDNVDHNTLTTLGSEVLKVAR